MTLFVGILTVMMQKYEFASNKTIDELLKIVIPSNKHFEGMFGEIFSKYLSYHQLLSVDSHREGQNELTYLVRFKKRAEDRSDLIKMIKNLNGQNEVYIVNTDYLTY